LKRFQSSRVDFQLSIFVKITSADDQSMSKPVDLIDSLSAQTCFFMAFVFAGCRQCDNVEIFLKRIADEMIDTQENNIVADIKSFRANGIQVYHLFDFIVFLYFSTNSLIGAS